MLVPEPEVCERMGDKYLAHLFFEEHGIPSPRSWLPGDVPDDARYPLLVKVREGFGSRHIYRAHDRARARLLPRLHARSTRSCRSAAAGEEFSIDVFCDLEGRCLNAIPRTMIQSKGGESIKGDVDQGLGADRARAAVSPRRSASSARRTSSASASRTGRCPVTDVNPRFGGAFPLPLAAGSRYPELALALANGERPEPTLGEFRAGVLMTRFFSHLCLTAGDGGSLVPFAEELPEPVAGEPGEA